MTSKIVGAINPSDYDPDFFESEPFPIPYFEDKKLKVGFADGAHESFVLKADLALENFLRLGSSDRIEEALMVQEYYQMILKHGYTEQLPLKELADIWNYVYPTELIIAGDENDDFYVCVSCGCAWEEEHGLQLVFRNGEKLTRASGHDGGYTDD